MKTLRSAGAWREIIHTALSTLDLRKDPVELYEPLTYFLSLGGKRMRPVLVMMANELFGGKETDALQPALGIELFHNFTLLHDDIMDHSPLRRSMPTVHEKWNENIAILSGDALFVESCKLIMKCPATVMHAVMDVFLNNALKVCEGQQYDMNFETEKRITVDEYIHMIGLKTAALLGAALQIGALTGGASKEDAAALYQFGMSMGIAFQLQDDILDVFGDAEKFGKKPGRDIVANKKTFLLIRALELSNADQRKSLEEWLNDKGKNEEEKVKAVTKLYTELHIRDLARKEMESHYKNGIEAIRSVGVMESDKKLLIDFADSLMERES